MGISRGNTAPKCPHSAAPGRVGLLRRWGFLRLFSGLIYTFDLAGYRPSALRAGERGRYTLGGFTDATFTVMKVLEGGGNAGWPFVA